MLLLLLLVPPSLSEESSGRKLETRLFNFRPRATLAPTVAGDVWRLRKAPKTFIGDFVTSSDSSFRSSDSSFDSSSISSLVSDPLDSLSFESQLSSSPFCKCVPFIYSERAASRRSFNSTAFLCARSYTCSKMGAAVDEREDIREKKELGVAVAVGAGGMDWE